MKELKARVGHLERSAPKCRMEGEIDDERERCRKCARWRSFLPLPAFLLWYLSCRVIIFSCNHCYCTTISFGGSQQVGRRAPPEPDISSLLIKIGSCSPLLEFFLGDHAVTTLYGGWQPSMQHRVFRLTPPLVRVTCITLCLTLKARLTKWEARSVSAATYP